MIIWRHASWPLLWALRSPSCSSAISVVSVLKRSWYDTRVWQWSKRWRRIVVCNESRYNHQLAQIERECVNQDTRDFGLDDGSGIVNWTSLCKSESAGHLLFPYPTWQFAYPCSGSAHSYVLLTWASSATMSSSFISWENAHDGNRCFPQDLHFCAAI